MPPTRQSPGFVHLRFGKTANRPTDQIIAQELKSYGISIPPERLKRTRYGKPEIKGRTTPFFNISHDEDDYLLAVTDIASVGADIQSPFSGNHYKSALQTIFSAEEIRHMDNPALWWAVKESLTKQAGSSLWLAPRGGLLPLMENLREGRWQRLVRGEGDTPETSDTPPVPWIYVFGYQGKWCAVSLSLSENPPSPEFIPAD